MYIQWHPASINPLKGPLLQKKILNDFPDQNNSFLNSYIVFVPILDSIPHHYLTGSKSSGTCIACGLGTYGTQSSASSASACVSCWSNDNSQFKAKKQCLRHNQLRIRPADNASTFSFQSPGSQTFLCRFGDGDLFPEYPCSVPQLHSSVKTNCDFEAALLCRWRPMSEETLAWTLQCH